MKNIEEIKKKYFINYKFSTETFENGLDFIVNNKRVYLSKFNDNLKKNGGIIVYSFNDKKTEELEVNGTPKSIELFSKDLLLISKHNTNEIVLFNIKSKKEIEFIKNKNFLNIVKIGFFDNRLYLVDSFAHTIYIYSKDGVKLDFIDLRKKFEFPASCLLIKDEILIINNNNMKIGEASKYCSSYKIDSHNLIRFDNKTKTIIPLHIVQSESPFHPFSIDRDEFDNYFLLNGTHIYKYDKNNELIFKYDLRRSLSVILKKSFLNSWFYKLKIENNQLYVYERTMSGRIYVFDI